MRKLTNRTELITIIMLIFFAIVLSLMAGISRLIFPSPLSPLLIGGLVVAGAVVLTWFRKPSWVMYAALLVAFLPTGLISPSLQSMLNRVLLVFALGFWLWNVISNRKKITLRTSHWLFLAFLGWGLVSLIWSENIDASLTVIQTYLLRFLLFFLVLLDWIHTKNDLNQFMSVLAIIGWILIISSTLTILITGYLPGTRLQVADTNSNGLGITALIALPGVLWPAIGKRTPKKGLYYLLAFFYLILSIVIVAASGSRGSAISLIVTLLILLFFRQTRSWSIICILLLFFMALLTPSIFTTTIERFTGVSGDPMLGGREYIWPASIQLISDHLWLGVGIGVSPYAVLPYLQMYTSVAQYSHGSLHSPILSIFADLGIPGILLYLGILIGAIFSFIRKARYDYVQKMYLLFPYYALVTAVFFGYMVSWIKGGGMESGHSYFLMLALLLIPANLDRKPSDILTRQTGNEI